MTTIGSVTFDERSLARISSRIKGMRRVGTRFLMGNAFKFEPRAFHADDHVLGSGHYTLPVRTAG